MSTIMQLLRLFFLRSASGTVYKLTDINSHDDKYENYGRGKWRVKFVVPGKEREVEFLSY